MVWGKRLLGPGLLQPGSVSVTATPGDKTPAHSPSCPSHPCTTPCPGECCPFPQGLWPGIVTGQSVGLDCLSLLEPIDQTQG